MDSTLDAEVLAEWVDNRRTTTDLVSAGQARRLQETLDHDASLVAGDPLPPLWHWIYHLESAPMGDLGADGHLTTGGFLPPVGLPRRMAAGGQFEFVAPITIGDRLTRTSTIKSIVLKLGASGQLCFVTVEHRYTVDGETRLIENQDIVYRDTPNTEVGPPPAAKKAPERPEWTRTVEPSTVLLFRYSALTFNSHRIHYDRAYCQEIESYPGLIFHGPLTATLLAESITEVTGQSLATFSYRAVSPLYDTAPFTIGIKEEHDGLVAWAEAPNAGLAMSAKATLST